MYLSLSLYIYIYIYIEREREGEILGFCVSRDRVRGMLGLVMTVTMREELVFL